MYAPLLWLAGYTNYKFIYAEKVNQPTSRLTETKSFVRNFA